MLNLEGATTIRIPAFANMPVQPVFVEEGKPAPNVQWNFAASTVLRTRSQNSDAGGGHRGTGKRDARNSESPLSAECWLTLQTVGLTPSAFGTAAADAVKPAGLLHNVTPIAAATAGLDALYEDLGNLAGAIGAAGIDASNVVYVAGPREAQIIKAKVGARFNRLC